MQIQRQLTSKLPWVECFSPSIEAKFNELNRSLDALENSDRVEEIGLTREAVDGIALNPETPEDITRNFIDVMMQADNLLKAGVPPYFLHYILNVEGLRLVSLKLAAVC